MSFIIPTKEQISKINSSVRPKVVIHDNKYWYVKTTPDVNRSFLGYLLGKDICNIAETILLSDVDVLELKSLLSLPIDASPNNTLLIRIASSHEIEELPCKTLEKAVATELVYSIWIRRRDTHALNREYIEGIPVFYDFHIAFMAEIKWIHSTMFFKDSPDYGHPRFWRVKQSTETLSTDKVREVITINDLAWHYVRNIEQFIRELSMAEEAVKDISDTDIRNKIILAGFDTTSVDIIEDFLLRNLNTLHSDIDEMKKIIFQ